MQTETLFEIAPTQIPSWFTAGSTAAKRHIHNVIRGLHPLGAQLGSPESRCSSCRFLVRTEHKWRRYLKCGQMRPFWTHGNATNLRRKWRACSLYKPLADASSSSLG